MSNPINVSNGGPNIIRISGGTLASPIDVQGGSSQSVTAIETAPVTITVLPLDGDGLAGGHGEEGG
jgi:hypothetical protein